MECFFSFSCMGEDLISRIRGGHQQALPLRVFLSLWPGREDGETVFISHSRGHGGLKMVVPAGRPNIARMTPVP